MTVHASILTRLEKHAPGLVPTLMGSISRDADAVVELAGLAALREWIRTEYWSGRIEHDAASIAADGAGVHLFLVCNARSVDSTKIGTGPDLASAIDAALAHIWREER